MKDRLDSLQDHLALCQREISSLNRLNKITATNSAVTTIRNKTKNFIHFEEEGEGICKDVDVDDEEMEEEEEEEEEEEIGRAHV